jgi:hypothetical protein
MQPSTSAGSTVSAFNQMMRNFLEELHATFPEETKVHLVLEAFDDLARINAKKPMELFVASLAPYAALVTAKSAALFDQPIILPGGLDMSSLWSKEDVTSETRDAIWQYIQMLFMLGTTVQNLPPQLLATIESVAMNCATQMQSGDSPVDFASLSGMLMGSLGNMMGSGGGGLDSLASLASLGGLGSLGSLGGNTRDTRPSKTRAPKLRIKGPR